MTASLFSMRSSRPSGPVRRQAVPIWPGWSATMSTGLGTHRWLWVSDLPRRGSGLGRGSGRRSTTRWPGRSTASTRQSGSRSKDRGAKSTRSRSPPPNGSTGLQPPAPPRCSRWTDADHLGDCCPHPRSGIRNLHDLGGTILITSIRTGKSVLHQVTPFGAAIVYSTRGRRTGASRFDHRHRLAAGHDQQVSESV